MCGARVRQTLAVIGEPRPSIPTPVIVRESAGSIFGAAGVKEWILRFRAG
jgi:hypothetical protein